MEIVFSPAQNVTADIYAAHYEQILTDKIALEMIRQDYVELPDQIFSGRGEVSGEVVNYVFLYNLTVTAVSPERNVSRSFPVSLLETKRETYPIYVNLRGGGVNATVAQETGQYAMIRFAAPPEAGGIVNVTVKDEIRLPWRNHAPHSENAGDRHKLDCSLLEGERPVWRGRISWKAQWWLLLLGVLTIWFFGLGIIFFIIAIIRVYSSEYFVTNKRVYVKYGLIAREIFDLKNEWITNYIVKQGVIGRILSFGDIVISTSRSLRWYRRDARRLRPHTCQDTT
ncbi:MAG: PH domain-containing protein [archaeon GB-1845-036]|nr:PH domain-containing protein [Candidatus Culexmicrobium thermophilum]